MQALPRRRLAGLLLVLLGAALLGGIVLLADNPVDLASYLGRSGTEPVGLFVARGPAAGEYDAANGTTLVVFACGHGACDTALRVEGDVTGELDRRHFLLEPKDDGAPFERQTLADGVPAQVGAVELNHTVAQASVNEYRISSPWPRTLLTDAGVVLVAAGAIMYAPLQGPRTRAWLLATSVAGVAVGHLLAFAGGTPRILALVVLLPALAVGALLALPRRTRVGGLGVVLLAGLALLVALSLAAYFPAGPEV